MNRIKNILISLAAGAGLAGCVSSGDRMIYQQLAQSPQGNLVEVQAYEEYHAGDNSNYFVQNHPQFFPEAMNYERNLWQENAHTSPLIFQNAGCVEAHILEETRGANFLNPVDRAHAEERASQIREHEWNHQVKQWNRQIESQGGKRAKPSY